MAERTIELAVPELAPELGESCHHCLGRLAVIMLGLAGVLRVHIIGRKNFKQICIHYDPTIVSPAMVNHRMQEASRRFALSYRHESIPFERGTLGTATDTLGDLLRALPGVVHAHVDYGEGVASVAYDTGITWQALITRAMQWAGFPPSSSETGMPGVKG